MRERERECTHFFGGREVAVTGGLALELSSSHLSKLKHRTKRERVCVSLQKLALPLVLSTRFSLLLTVKVERPLDSRLLDIYWTCLAAVFRFIAPVPLAIYS